MRSEAEIREELARLRAYDKGSYEELAGAEGALMWVLAEHDFAVVDWSAGHDKEEDDR